MAVAVLALAATGAGAGCASGGVALGFHAPGASFCEQLRDLRDLTTDLTRLDESTALANGVEALEELAEAAPPDIRPDVEVLYQQARLVAETFQELDPDDPASLSELGDLLADVDLGEVQQAAARIGQYVTEHCGADADQTEDDDDGGG
jgi:hypothetical protein